MIKIIVDTASDYTLEEANEKNIKLVPLQIRFGEESYLDQYELSKDAFFENLLNGKKGSTSQPSPEAFVKHYDEVKKTNDTILVISLSSKVSGTYQSANLAKSIVDYDDIHLVDSLSAGLGTKLVVNYAHKLVNEGKDINEIVKVLNDCATKINTRYVPESLEDLFRGGRLSKEESSNNGKMKSVIQLVNGGVGEFGKFRGNKNAIHALMEEMEQCDVDTNMPIAVGYTTNLEFYEMLKDEIIKRYPNAEILEDKIGAVVGSHFGPGVFGLSYKIK